MWKITLTLNVLLMALLAFASKASQILLLNHFVDYPEYNTGAMLPAMSLFALRVQWIIIVIPVLWTLLTVAIAAYYSKRLDIIHDAVQLHTSATLIVGLTMLGYFMLAGLLPFLRFTVKLGS